MRTSGVVVHVVCGGGRYIFVRRAFVGGIVVAVVERGELIECIRLLPLNRYFTAWLFLPRSQDSLCIPGIGLGGSDTDYRNAAAALESQLFQPPLPPPQAKQPLLESPQPMAASASQQPPLPFGGAVDLLGNAADRSPMAKRSPRKRFFFCGRIVCKKRKSITNVHNLHSSLAGIDESATDQQRRCWRRIATRQRRGDRHGDV